MPRVTLWNNWQGRNLHSKLRHLLEYFVNLASPFSDRYQKPFCWTGFSSSVNTDICWSNCWWKEVALPGGERAHCLLCIDHSAKASRLTQPSISTSSRQSCLIKWSSGERNQGNVSEATSSELVQTRTSFPTEKDITPPSRSASPLIWSDAPWNLISNFNNWSTVIRRVPWK